MRIAAISDVHGNLGALDAVLADIARRGVDATVNLGDLLSGPLQPRETADRLIALDVPTIRGNHERQLLTLTTDMMGASDRYAAEAIRHDQRDWLLSLPPTLQMWDDVLLVHGTPDDDLQPFLETVDERGCRPATLHEATQRAGRTDAALVLCGHTHLPRSLRLDDGRLIVNAGSVGLQAYEEDRPYPHRIENGTPQARYVIVERGPSGWSAEFIAVDYDWDAAAALALRNGREDWARALATGRL